MIKRLLAAPPFHFVVIGALLYVAQGFWDGGEAAPAPVADRSIVVSAATFDDLQRGFRETAGRDPNGAEVDALVRDYADNEILYREALAHRLDQDDRSVRWRLVQKMQFLGEAAAEDVTDAEREELYREALALGLDRDDLVIRRLLIAKMRLLIALGAAGEGPTEADLQRYYEANAEEYRQPARVSLRHVFFSADQRGERLQADARELLARLRGASTAPAEAIRLGDAFSLGHELRGSSQHNLAKLLGAQFANAAIELSPGAWHGPIPSAYGLHLVWIDERRESRLPLLEAVRTQVSQRYLAERREAVLNAAMSRLREQYSVVVANRDSESTR